MTNIERLLILLEEIAHLMSRGSLEKKEYLERLYASSKCKSETVHGDMRARPTARAGEMPEHEPRGATQIRVNPRKGVAYVKREGIIKATNDRGVLK